MRCTRVRVQITYFDVNWVSRGDNPGFGITDDLGVLIVLVGRHFCKIDSNFLNVGCALVRVGVGDPYWVKVKEGLDGS
jgi:hypothetical protein